MKWKCEEEKSENLKGESGKRKRKLQTGFTVSLRAGEYHEYSPGEKVCAGVPLQVR